MAVDKNKLEIHDKNVNLLVKIHTIYKNYVDICALSLTILLGKRGRVRLQGRMC